MTAGAATTASRPIRPSHRPIIGAAASAELERTVLATLLLRPEWIAELGQNYPGPGNFTDPVLGAVASVLFDFAHAGRLPDLSLVHKELVQRGFGDEALVALAMLADDVEDSYRVAQSCEALIDLSRGLRSAALYEEIQHAAEALAESPGHGGAISKLRRLLRDVEGLTAVAPSVRLLTPEEFATDMAPEPVVLGLIYFASTTLYTGASKAGKTWQALQIAMSVAAGIDFLGLEVQRGKTLYLSLELSAGMLRERMQAISRDVGIPIPEIGVDLHVVAPTAEYVPHLDLASDAGCEQLRRLISQAGARLVVLDTLYRFVPGTDPNDNGEMGVVFGRLNDLAQSTGAALLVLDHVGKGEQSGPVSHSAIGASVKGGAARVVAALKRTSKEDGGRWEMNVESHFGSWEEPIFYERPKRSDGTRGAGCALCTATEAHGISFEKVRDLFKHFAERIDGRVVFPSKRKLIDGLISSKLASGVAQGEEVVTAIRRDLCAPETAGWRGADRPIRTSTGPRDAVVFAWVADLEEPVHDA